MDLSAVRTLRERLHEQVRRVVDRPGTGPGPDAPRAALPRATCCSRASRAPPRPCWRAASPRACGCDFQRIQFTPDLMPGDVLGTNLFNFQTNTFTLTKGPIFTELLLADEINRTPPKTQAALLEAMQERAVTIDGTTHDLGRGFMVSRRRTRSSRRAPTRCPRPSSTASSSRSTIDYPDRDQEREMVRRARPPHGHAATSTTFGSSPSPTGAVWSGARERSREIRVCRRDRGLRRGPRARDARATRRCSCGASPRAANMLARGVARARRAAGPRLRDPRRRQGASRCPRCAPRGAGAGRRDRGARRARQSSTQVARARCRRPADADRPTDRCAASCSRRGFPVALAPVARRARLWPLWLAVVALVGRARGARRAAAASPRRSLAVRGRGAADALYIGDAVAPAVDLRTAARGAGPTVDVLADLDAELVAAAPASPCVPGGDGRARASPLRRRCAAARVAVERLWLRWRGPLGSCAAQRRQDVGPRDRRRARHRRRAPRPRSASSRPRAS